MRRGRSRCPVPTCAYWIGFHLTPGVGAARIGRLVERFGSVEAAWRATDRELRGAGLPVDVVSSLIAERAKIDLDRELERLARHDVRALAARRPDYPRLLRHIPSPPPILYVRGELLASDELAVGVVGTRRATGYGTDMAARIAGGLARRG